MPATSNTRRSAPALETLEDRTLLSFTSAVNYDTYDLTRPPPHNEGRGPNAVAVGDLRGIGILDIVTANFDVLGPGDVSVLLGNGDGTFQHARTYATGGEGPKAVALGSFRGNAKLDIAVADLVSGDVSILYGSPSGDGTFSNGPRYTAGPSPTALAVGDLRGNNTLDIVVANNTNPGQVTVMLGDGNGTFPMITTYALGAPSFNPVAVALGHFSNDGHLDVAVANSFSNNVTVLLGDGTGAFRLISHWDVGVTPVSLAVGDFNEDGKDDIVTANNTSGDVTVLDRKSVV